MRETVGVMERPKTMEQGPAECLHCGYTWEMRLGGTVKGTRARPGMTLCPNCRGWPVAIDVVDIDLQGRLGL